MEESRFLLEEPDWSKTIVERLPKRYKEAAESLPKNSMRSDAIARNAGNTPDARRPLESRALAGLFKFDRVWFSTLISPTCRSLTEFDDVREKILDRFRNIMEKHPRRL